MHLLALLFLPLKDRAAGSSLIASSIVRSLTTASVFPFSITRIFTFLIVYFTSTFFLHTPTGRSFVQLPSTADLCIGSDWIVFNRPIFRICYSPARIDSLTSFALMFPDESFFAVSGVAWKTFNVPLCSELCMSLIPFSIPWS